MISHFPFSCPTKIEINNKWNNSFQHTNFSFHFNKIVHFNPVGLHAFYQPSFVWCNIIACTFIIFCALLLVLAFVLIHLHSIYGVNRYKCVGIRYIRLMVLLFSPVLHHDASVGSVGFASLCININFVMHENKQKLVDIQQIDNFIQHHRGKFYWKSWQILKTRKWKLDNVSDSERQKERTGREREREKRDEWGLVKAKERRSRRREKINKFVSIWIYLMKLCITWKSASFNFECCFWTLWKWTSNRQRESTRLKIGKCIWAKKKTIHCIK